MNLSAPIHQLKRKARLMSRAERIPLHAALDRIAAEEGYRSWSLLTAKQPGMTSVCAFWSLLEPGDLALVAGRPGQGKTLASLALLAEAMRAMKSLHEAATPDESTEDIDATIPGGAFAAFVDAHAALLYKIAHSSMAPTKEA